jgi:hypothetical protein
LKIGLVSENEIEFFFKIGLEIGKADPIVLFFE